MLSLRSLQPDPGRGDANLVARTGCSRGELLADHRHVFCSAAVARGERLQAAPFAEFTRALAIPKLSKRRVPHIAKREVREIDAAVGFTGRLDVDESFDVVAWIKPNGCNRICEPGAILFFRKR